MKTDASDPTNWGRLILAMFTMLLPGMIYAQAPVITGVSPAAAPIGATVTINGTNFDPTAANNTVYFGAVKAAVATGNSNSLTLTIPFGATYAPVAVTASSFTAYSSAPFVVTFPSSRVVDATSFQTTVNFPSGSHPVGVSVGDVNNDGKPDLAAANEGTNTVSVYQNTSSTGSITSGSFAPQVDLIVSSGPNGVYFSDIDGDGKLDLVVSHTSSSLVSVFRNISAGGSISAGSFAAKVDLTVAGSLGEVAIGDLDLDGRPDLAVTNYFAGTVSIYKNTSTPGSISFAANVDFGVGSSPDGVVIGELNGDTKPEVVVSNYSSGGLSVLKNTSTPGSVTFLPKLDLATPSQPGSPVLGDLDGDGKLDIAANNTMTGVSFHRNTSTGGDLSFVRTDYSASGSSGLALSDVDGNGRPDVVVGVYSGSSIRVLRNTSQVGSISFASASAFELGSLAYGVAAGDLDLDGKPELVAASYGMNAVSVFRNVVAPPPPVPSLTLPAAGSTTPSTSVTFMWSSSAGATAYHLQVAVDSFFTTLVANEASLTDTTFVLPGLVDNVTYFWHVQATQGEGASDFSAFRKVSISAPPGAPQNLTATALSTKIQVHWNKSTALDILRYRIYLGTVPNPTAMVDSTTSGVIDTSKILTGLVNATMYYVRVTAVDSAGNEGNFSNEVDATPLALQIVSMTPAPNAKDIDFVQPFSITFNFDIDTASVSNVALRVDGSQSGPHALSRSYDFGTHTLTASPVTPFAAGERISVAVTRGITAPSGDSLSGPLVRQFFAKTTSAGVYFANRRTLDAYGTAYDGLTSADVNGDAKIDLVMAHAPSDSLEILLNDGAGGFLAPVVYHGPTNPWSVRLGDLDRDGDIDIAASYSGGIDILVNSGTGTFSALTTVSTGGIPVRMALGDIDGDGDLDIVAVRHDAGAVTVFKNNGNATFGAGSDVGSFSFPNSVAVGDVDNDGDLDAVIVFGGASSGDVGVLLNDGTGGCSAGGTYHFAPRGSEVVSLADVTGDGSADIIISEVGNGGAGVGSELVVFSNNGSGAFAELGRPATGTGPYGHTVGDVNGDGTLDLVVPSYASMDVTILSNQETGTFTTPQTIATGQDVNLSTLADFDGDGDLDLAVATSGARQAYVYENIQHPSPLVAYYPFNGNTADLSGNGNDGINNGATTTSDRFGNPSAALAFDGTSAYVRVLESSSLTIPGDIAVCAWVKVSSPQSNRIIVEKFYGPFADHGWILNTSTDGTARLEGHDGRGGGTLKSGNTGQFSDGNWHFLVGQRQGNLWSVFLDGALAASADAGGTAGSIESGEGVRIGASDGTSDGGGIGNYWAGSIDDIRIYSHALSGGELDSLYHEGTWPPNPPPSAPQGIFAATGRGKVELRWRPNPEGDVSHYAVYQGGPTGLLNFVNSTSSRLDTTFTFTGLDNDSLYRFAVSAVDSAFLEGPLSDTVRAVPTVEAGRALALDGSGGWAESAFSPSLHFSGGATIEAWFNAASVAINDREIIRVEAGGGHGMELFVAGTGDLFGSAYLGTWTSLLTSGLNLKDDQWHHAALQVDGTLMTLYLDGVYVAAENGSAPFVFDSAKVLIGRTPSSNFFHGMIDEVRVWNTGRTQEEIRAGMVRPVASDAPGLLAAYHLDEPYGDMAYDGTSGKSHAILFGGTGRVLSGAMAPRKPSLITAVPSDSRVTLSWLWNGEADLARYRIFSGLSPAPTTQVDSASWTDTTATLAGLTNGVIHYFRIAAVDSAGNASAFSNQLSALPVNMPICVSTGGNDANSGTFDAPLRNIQTALNRAEAGDTIKVAEGSYSEGLTTGVQVILLGGYTPGFDDSARNILTHKTFVEGVTTVMLTDAAGSTVDGFIFRATSSVTGAGIRLSNGSVLRHNIIRDMTATFVPALDLTGGVLVTNNTIYGGSEWIEYTAEIGTPSVRNNIFSNGTWGFYGGTLAASNRPYNLVYGATYPYGPSGDTNPGIGDVSADPRFLNIANNDFRIPEASTALNAGDPSDPPDFEPAPYHTRIDMGAYGGTIHSPYLPAIPLAPSPALPTNGATQQARTMTLRWLSLPEVSAYRLQVATDSSFASGMILDDSTQTDTSEVVGPFGINATIYWRVSAKVTLGSGPFSVTYRYTTTPGLFCVAVTGNDSNVGSNGAPLRNIQTALTRATDGDTVKVAEGSYTEWLTTTSTCILRGGYTSSFFEDTRDIFVHKTIVQAAATFMLTDTKGSTIDGFFFIASGSVTVAGIRVSNGSVLTHNIIRGMSYAFAPAIEATGGALVTNNTVYGGSEWLQLYDGTGTPSVRNNIFSTGTWGIQTGSFTAAVRPYNLLNAALYPYGSGAGDANPGIGDVLDDPQFRDVTNNDFRLLESSPAVNAGDPSDPAGTEPAPYHTRVDMGAYGGTIHSPYLPAVPSVPTLSLPTDGAIHQSRTITLQWMRSMEVTDYHIQVATDPTFATGIVADVSSVTDTFKVVSGLDLLTTYYWRVSARVTLGTGPYSAPRAFTTTSGVLCVSPSGSDLNSGSPAAPLQYIPTALSRSAAGDTIKIAGGTFNGGFTTQRQVLLRGGYSTSFLESGRNVIDNRTTLTGISPTMVVDNVGSTIEGFFFSGSSSVSDAAIKVYAGSTVRQNVIRNVSSGRAIRVYGGATVLNNTVYACTYGIEINTGTGTPVVENNVVSNGSWGMYSNAYSSAVRPYNLVYGNSFNYSGSDANPGNGDIALSPGFVNPAGNDLRLQSSSPAINAGDPAVQYNDPDGTRSDMGAYFYDAPPAAPSALAAFPGTHAVTLTWNAASEADFLHYNVYGGTSAAPTTIVSTVTDQMSASVFLSDLTFNVMYHFRITTVDRAGYESSYSNEVSSIPLGTPIERDSLALVDLYNGTGGPNWVNSTNWLTGPLESWYGVTLVGGRLYSLWMDGNNLAGTLPASIGDATELRGLGLANNHLSGSIPSSIGNLTALDDLRLYLNELSGSIPLELCSIPSLRVLYLNANQLSGSIPPEIGNLTHLVLLDVSNNQLSGPVPSTIGSLTNLGVLVLQGNLLSGPLPSELCQLTALTDLWISINRFTGAIPDSIVRLTSLLNLRLDDNQFDQLPDLSPLSNLDALAVENNRLTIADLEPNVGVANTNFWYAPQDTVGVERDTTVIWKSSLFFTVPYGSPTTVYHWMHNGVELGSGGGGLEIPSVDSAMTGTYSWWSTSSLLPGLTLYSRPIHVGVEPTPLQRDSLALVDLYNSTNGAAWTNKTNWLSGSLETWYGITMDGGRVSNVVLGSNNLTGTIPPSLGAMTDLLVLELNDNHLTGVIPDGIGGLTHITRILLYANQLTGTIPVAIGNLTSLDGLALHTNLLTGSIPPELGNLTHLTELLLNSNQLSGSIPAEIGSMTELRRLQLHSNNLTGPIPAAIGNLSNLNHLLLYSNQLTGSIPVAIGDLTQLVTLAIGTNQLSGEIPAQIGNLRNLVEFSVGENQMSGTIPDAIGRLDSLGILDLHRNFFAGALTDSVVRLTRLWYLNLWDDDLDALPDLSPLVSLAELHASENRFTFADLEPNVGIASTTFAYAPQDSVGAERDTTVIWKSSLFFTVPYASPNTVYHWMHNGVELGSGGGGLEVSTVDSTMTGTYSWWATNSMLPGLTLHSRLVHVSVQPSPYQRDSLALVDFFNSTGGAGWTIKTNWLTGPLETWYGVTVEGGRVTHLNLTYNNISGVIPEAVGWLSHLRTLDLSVNALSGSIPASLAQDTSLWTLNLGTNGLTGEIPDVLGGLPNIRYLSLVSNGLTGSIPASLGNLSMLEVLDLGSNQLSGIIPDALGQLVNLLQLHLDNLPGLTEGAIPSWVSGLFRLRILSISSARRTGMIPTDLGNLADLRVVNLSGNTLSGTLPFSLANLTSLQSLIVSLNQLSGVLPAFVGDLVNLRDVQVHGNAFDGAIPVELGRLVQLTTLNLSDNRFSGPVPDSLRSLVNLSQFHLANNELIGLPDFETLVNLENFSVHGNRLTFADLEPNVEVPHGSFAYTPQDSVDAERDTTVAWRSTLILSAPEDGANTQYQWMREGMEVGSPGRVLTIAAIDTTEAGTYSWRSTNTTLTGLTLYGRPIHLFVAPTPFQRDSLALVDLYNSTNGPAWTNRTNWLTGPLDTWYGITLSGGRVYEIGLHNNNLSGPIPASIGDLNAVWKLEMGGNHLIGGLPAAIGNMTELAVLQIWTNELTGPIPSELGNLSNLIQIYLNQNQLTGTIPTSLAAIPRLGELNLTTNQLTGIIPPELGSLPELLTLELGWNQLTGPLPVELANDTKLFALDVRNNLLTGAIPQEIGRLTAMRWLFLQDNRFTGAVPDSIVRLTNLEKLFLGNNDLDVLPDLSPLVQLTYLDVGGNRLTFGELEPNVNVASPYFNANPQDSVGFARDTVVLFGSTVTLTVLIDGSANQYQWLHDGSIIPSATSSALVLTSATSADDGAYVCSVTNSVVTGLTLYTRPITVSVRVVLPGEYVTDASTQLLWHLNELSGSTISDASGSGYDGTATGTSIVAGRFGNARKIEQTGDQIQSTYTAPLGTSPFTVEAWAYLDDMTLANNFLLGNNQLQLSVYQDGAIRFFTIYGQLTTPAGLVSVGEWNHIAVTRDGDNVLRIHKNGVRVFVGSLPGDFSGGTAMAMYFMHGSLDEIRFSTVARAPQEFNLQLPPVNLKRTTLSSTSIRLDWQNGGGGVPLMSYRIYRDADSSGRTEIGATAATTWTDATVTPSSVYYYRVSAVDSTGFESPPTPAVRGTTPGTTGLVAYYPFSGNASDSSGYENHGTNDGATLSTDRFGRPNAAYDFNGTSSRIICSSGPSLNLTNGLTISAWIKPRSLVTSRIVSRYDGSGGYELLLVGTDIWTNLNSTGVAPASVATLSNRWIHLVTTWDGATIRTYINGTQASSGSFPTALVPSSNPLVIGQIASLLPEYFNGVIDDIRIYDRAIGSAEVSDLYYENGWVPDLPPAVPTGLTATAGDMQVTLTWQANVEPDLACYRVYAGNTSFPTSLVDSVVSGSTSYSLVDLVNGVPLYFRVTAVDNAGYESAFSENVVATPLRPLLGEYSPDSQTALLLHMNETSGTVVCDVSGHSNHGYVPAGTIAGGKFGNATTGTARVMSSPSLNPPDALTVECWVYVTGGTGTHRMLVSKDNGAGDRQYLLLVSDTDRFRGHVRTTSKDNLVESSRPVEMNRWYHVAMTYDSHVLRLYVNGVCEGTVSIEEPMISNEEDIAVTAPGSIDEVRISSIARTPAEFNLQLPPVNFAAGATGTTVTLSWQNGGGAVGLLRYKIYRGADSTSMTLVDSTSGTGYSNAGLAVGTTYFYRISAIDSTGFEGIRSFAASATTNAAAAPPGTPTLAGPANSAVDVSLTPTLTWRSSVGAATYRIQVSPLSDFTALSIDTPNLTDTSFTVPAATLNNYQPYYWRVMASNAVGFSSFSSVRMFRTIPTIPPQVTLESPADAAGDRPIGLTLSWNAAETADAYRVQVSTASDFGTIVLDSSGVASTSLAPTNLQHSVLYYWRVRASNAAGSGPYSSTRSFTTIIAPPNAPILVSPANGVADQPASVQFVWNAAARAATYELTVATDPSFTSVFSSVSNLTDTSFTVNGFAHSTLYYWRVSSRNVNTSAQSSARSFTTVVAPPEQVALSTPANGVSNIAVDGQVLSWSGVANATSYHLQVSSDAVFSIFVVNDSLVTATSKQISGLQVARTYYWRVKAKNAGGSGPFSEAWSFATVVSAPGQVTLLQPADAAQNQPPALTLSWNSVSGASTYEVQVATSTIFVPTVFSSSAIPGTSVQPTGLANNVVYYWRVRAANGGGNGPFSVARSFTTVIAAPAPPTLVSPVDVTTGATTTLTFTWSPSARASTYDIEFASDALFAIIVRTVSDLTATSETVTGLNSSTQYYWRVRARNAGGTAVSGSWSFTTRPPVPAVPTLASPLDGATNQSLTPTLMWNSSAGATMYYLQVAGAIDFVDLLVNTTTAGTSATVPQGVLANLTTYYWRVRARNSYDTTAYSAARSFTTALALPAVPVLASPAAGAQNQSTSPNLAWYAAPRATSYRIQVATSVNFQSGITADDSLHADTSYALTSLNLNTTYYWRVNSNNESGSSAFSAGRSFSTVSVPPSPPTSIAATPMPGRRVRIEWAPGSTNEENFRVERRNGGVFAEIASRPAGSTSHMDSLLLESTSYTYRVRAYNAVGFSSYSADASAMTLDETAPSAPTGLASSAVGWTRQNTMTVSWSGPTDPSGIVRVWYGFNAAPTVGSPGTSVNASGGSASIPLSTLGVNTIYVYLEDGAGNKNPASAGSVTVRYDNLLPVITHDSNAVATFSTANPQAVAIVASATDVPSGMKTLQLQYRRAGTPWSQGQSLPYLSPTGTLASVPEAYLDTHKNFGVDYRIVAEDSAGNIAMTPTHSIRIQVGEVVQRRDPNTGSPVVQASVNALPSSAPTTFAYRMFSVPMDLTDKTPKNVFETQTGLPSYNDETWRFYKLKENIGNSASDPFDEYPAFSNLSILTPGRAFLLILKSGIVVKTGPGTLLKAEEYNKTGIALAAGYNFVGNPFAFDIPKDSLKLADGTQLTGKTASFVGVGGEQSGWHLNPDTLKAWEGWVVKVPSATSLRFNIADRGGSSASPPSARTVAAGESGPSWRIRVDAERKDNGVYDRGNIIGIDGQAADGDDEFDMFEPPLIGSGAISLGFETPDGLSAYDVRSNKETERVWKMVLRTPEPRVDVKLQVNGLETTGQPVYLFDLDTRTGMKLVKSEMLNVNSRSGVRRFRLVVGSESFAEQNSDGISLAPKTTALYQNFPNPFNPTTVISFTVGAPSDVEGRNGVQHATLTIFNVLGQEVTTLFNAAAQAGRLYEITFDGRNLPSGVYFARLEAGKERRMQRMILAK